MRSGYWLKWFLWIFISIGIVIILSTVTLANGGIEAGESPDYIYDNSILVCMEKGKTEINSVYTPDDFPYLDVDYIEDLSVITNENLLKNREFVENYGQILQIHLKESKEEVDIYAEADKILKYSDLPISSVEPNRLVKTYLCTVPNDPLYATDQAAILSVIGMETAWSLSKGSSDIKVGIMDSDVYPHPDLIGNLGSQYNAVSQNNHMYSWPDSHGTSVAGIIGAVGDNSTDTAGICWNIKICPINIYRLWLFGVYEIDDAAYARSFSYLNNSGIFITNGSFANTDYCAAVEQAISNYYGIFVVAAGNDGVELNNHCKVYPACYNCDNIITVGGTIINNGTETLYDRTNFGEEYVDIFAPIGSMTLTYDYQTLTYGHDTFGGTSSAAPIVAGVAALMMNRNLSLTPREIKEMILESAEELDILDGMCSTGGRINALSAVLAAATTYYEEPISFNGDVNGDGTDDIIQYRGDNGKRDLFVFLSTNSTFTQMPIVSMTNRDYHSYDDAIIGDFNGDNKSDVIVLSYENNLRNFTFYTGQADGSFVENAFVQTDVFYSSTSIGAFYVVGDFNGDGYDDFSINMNKSGNDKLYNYLFFGGTTSMFINKRIVSSSIVNDSSATKSVFVEDVNQDGYDDIIVLNGKYSSNNVYVFWGGISNPLASVTSSTLSYASSSDRINDFRDINGDGYCDFIIAWKNASTNLNYGTFLGCGDGTFGVGSTVVTLFSYDEIDELFFLDFNSDDKTDIVIHSLSQTTPKTANYSLFLTQSNGISSTYSTFSFNAVRGYAYKHLIGHFYDDGLGDTIVCESTTGVTINGRFERIQMFLGLPSNTPTIYHFGLLKTHIPYMMSEQ